MKTKLLLALILFSFSSVTFAKDACASYLCMAGMAIGAGKSSECSDYVRDVADIRVFKHGKFKASRTSSKREGFLSSCPGADGGIVSSIISKFGYKYIF